MTHRTRFAIATAFLAIMVASAPGCGKNSTNPGGGGGGTKELNSGSIAGGGQYQHTFMTAGTYHYCCTIHGCSAMNANVTVADGVGNPATDDVNIVDFAFSKNAAVSVGGTVTWHNTTGSTNHTVTSD